MVKKHEIKVDRNQGCRDYEKGVDGLLGTYRRIFSDEPRTLEGINAGSELECQRHQILKRSCSSLRTAAEGGQEIGSYSVG